MRSPFAFVLLLLGAVPSAAGTLTEITQCAQTVDRGTAFLSSDLDCSASAGFPALRGSVILSRAKLDLRGFSIVGPEEGPAIRCSSHCTVFSSLEGATITSTAFAGPASNEAVAAKDPDFNVLKNIKITVRDLTILRGSVQSFGGRVRVDGVTFVEPPAEYKLVNQSAVEGGRAVTISNSSFINNDAPIISNALSLRSKTKLKNVSITGTTAVGGGPEYVVAAGRLVMKDSIMSQAEGTCFGVNGGLKKAVIVNSVINECSEYGVYASRILLRNSELTNHGVSGTKLGDITMRNSIATGSGTDATCGVSRTCADISGWTLDIDSSSSCGTSYDPPSGFPGVSLGVCTFD